VQIGNLVSATSVLTTVSQVEPMKAFFSISEQEYLEAVQRHQGTALEAFGHRSPVIAFQLQLADGTIYQHTGEFLFADRQVDSLTGTIRVATSFPNPERVLRPGQFGRVSAALTVKHDALLVLQRAVTELQGTYQVAVVNDSNKVNIRTVTVGPKVDSLWVIERGLRAGERVVVEGTQKVNEGTTVRPTPFNSRPASRDTTARSSAPARY
jgi:membrane fusion protein (multidrug efflux system)